MARIVAVLPLKVPEKAKQRLASQVSAEDRAALVLAMAKDVLTALKQVEAITDCVLVSTHEAAAEIAQACRVRFLKEPDDLGGLNETVTWACDTLAAEGIETVLVVPGDVPLATGRDFSELLQSHRSAPAVTIARAASDGGTNALICTPPDVISFRFGKDSCQVHCDAAKAVDIAATVVENANIGLDVDEPDDLKQVAGRLAAHPGRSETAKILQRLFPAKPVDPIALLKDAAAGRAIADDDALMFADYLDAGLLQSVAASIRDAAYRNVVTYSRKVFIPLTQLCRDVCHYCTFAQPPRSLAEPFLPMDKILEMARAGAAAGCKEALFTLGEKPELRYRVAAEALEEMGFASTLDYLKEAARRVFEETGLFPHLNPGCMSEAEIASLKSVSPSMGLMLESSSERLCEKGGPHYGSPDKVPATRIAAIENAGKARVPLTTGILIGIGETRRERIESLLAIRALHAQYGHIQEVIVQNFRAKSGTRMVNAPEPDLNDLLWTISIARVLLPADISIQAPPNLSPGVLPQLVAAGINDWGGVSPLTPDFVNPEAPWPHLDKLEDATEEAGKCLAERLTIYPRYIEDARTWVDEALRTKLLRAVDADGLARTDNWSPGSLLSPPREVLSQLEHGSDRTVADDLREIVAQASSGQCLDEGQVVRLFQARGNEIGYLCRAADGLREEMKGDTITYVVNRNINYTNICYKGCQFCAFAKGKQNENLRGKPYDLSLEEIARRAHEGWMRGATEVCLQGGIHPSYTGQTYLDICHAIKAVCPDIHLHAFSPLEVDQGAETLGLSLAEFLSRLKDAGLGSLPGTAAEILDDEVRDVLCPDKLNTARWFEVVKTAHALGINTTSTIMYGHIDRPVNWARHLLSLRAAQIESLRNGLGRFTEFVPLPFVHMEAPIYLRGNSRKGPTFREALLMHAVARLVLHPHIPNIQTSWVKMGHEGVSACLKSGVNDLGGTLMNETISRAAGSALGQELAPPEMETLIVHNSRHPEQRSAIYKGVGNERRAASFDAGELSPVNNMLMKRRK
tara:strand:- start:10740 stop:13832 length:3093 start_codon:yes stop_codon:yes gene_type:complete